MEEKYQNGEMFRKDQAEGFRAGPKEQAISNHTPLETLDCSSRDSAFVTDLPLKTHSNSHWEVLHAPQVLLHAYVFLPSFFFGGGRGRRKAVILITTNTAVSL